MKKEKLLLDLEELPPELEELFRESFINWIVREVYLLNQAYYTNLWRNFDLKLVFKLSKNERELLFNFGVRKAQRLINKFKKINSTVAHTSSIDILTPMDYERRLAVIIAEWRRTANVDACTALSNLINALNTTLKV